MNKWVTTAIAAVASAGTLVAWVASVAGDAADTKRRVDTVEKRQIEDRQQQAEQRKEIREAVVENNAYVKTVDQNVQIILQKVSAIEAVQRAERRNDRGR